MPRSDEHVAFLLPLLLAACALLPSCQHEGPQHEQKLFTLLPPERTGITFENRVVDSEQQNILRYEYFYNGGGVSIGDINNDDLPDVFFTSNLGPNRLYLNQGHLKFKDITQEAGLFFDQDATWNTGTTMVDINDDGYLDIYVCRSGNLDSLNRANLLFINQKDGTFAQKAPAYGLDDKGYSVQAAFFDYDEDGDLDVYLASHGTGFYDFDPASAQRAASAQGGYDTDKLYENRGGVFADVTEQAGVAGTPYGYGLGVAAGDLNGDGWDDLYVANDFFEHDYLYYNNGDGTFSPAIEQATRHLSYSSMGVDVADYNNDSRLDLLVLDMAPDDHFRRMMNHTPLGGSHFYLNVRRGLHYQYSYNTLQLNNGNGTFSDAAWLAGLAKTDWSWAPLIADFDNDGKKDVFITNGLRRDILDRDFRVQVDKQLPAAKAAPDQPLFTDAATVRIIEEDMPSKKIKNYLFQNQGELAFQNKTASWGLGQPSFSNGAAYGDLDDDGDLDLVVNNLDGQAFVYRNEANAKSDSSSEETHYLRIRLKGRQGNWEALGAKVQVTSEAGVQFQQKYRTRGFQSSVEGPLHFGLGPAKTVEEIKVTWPDDATQVLRAIQADQVITIAYDASAYDASAYDASAGRRAELKEAPEGRPWFREAGEELGIQYEHQENPSNDFREQPLLPHSMAHLGPDLATGDVNADQREDFYVGGAKHSAGMLFVQHPDGSFAPSASQPWAQDEAREDLGSLLFDADGDGDLDLYVVSGGSEFAPKSPQLQDRLYLNDGAGLFEKSAGRLPPMRSSGSCVKAGDYDGDGDLDLFVGGRGQPGRYPLPSRSYLLENKGGAFEDVTQDVAPGLETPGMVTDALWTDVDADGRPELMVTGEWMPIRVFQYQEGRFREVTGRRGLAGSEGWWFSLAESDLDGDGDPDYLAGNNGLNFRYQTSPERPFSLFAADFDHNGSVDPVLGYYEGNTLYPLEARDALAEQMPRLRGRFLDYASYASSSLEAVLGQDALHEARQYTARTFASSALINQGDGTLKRRALPRKAQLSSVNGFVIDDFDGDGAPDVLLAGNLYEVEPRTPRNDAGNGLLLKGDGTGGFTPLDISHSGLFAPGNVKALERVQTSRGLLILIANNDGKLQAFLSSPPA